MLAVNNHTATVQHILPGQYGEVDEKNAGIRTFLAVGLLAPAPAGAKAHPSPYSTEGLGFVPPIRDPQAELRERITSLEARLLERDAERGTAAKAR